jgi:DNA-binding protein Fis
MANRRKLTPEVHKRICDLLRAGNYLETAAAVAGIDRGTIRKWIKRGQGDEEPYATFAADATKAMSEAEARDVLAISKGAAKDWRASAWRLERRNPKKWGQRINVTVEQELDEFFDKLERVLPAEVFAQVLEAAASEESGAEEAERAADDDAPR